MAAAIHWGRPRPPCQSVWWWLLGSSLALVHQISAAATPSKVLVTFQFVKGQFIPIITDEDYQLLIGVIANGSTSAISKNAIPKLASASFLILFLIVTMVSSALMIAAISSSLTLRRLPFNILLMNVAIVCFLESLFNIGLSVTYLILHPWRFGSYACFVNSYLMELTPLMYSALLTTLLFDRVFAIKDPAKYKKFFKLGCQRLSLVLYWFVALAIPIPLLAGLIESWPFPDRYSCQLMHEYSVYYGIATGTLLVLMLVAMVTAAVIINKVMSSERMKDRQILMSQQQRRFRGGPPVHMGAANGNNNRVFVNAPHLWNELRNLALVLALLVLYIIFLCPYLLRVKIDQIVQGYDLGYYRNLTMAKVKTESNGTVVNSTAVGLDGSMMSLASFVPTSPVTSKVQKGAIVLGSTYRNLEDNVVPEVTDSDMGALDSFLVWLRFSNFTLVPLLVLLAQKDIRKKVEYLACVCWRPNSVDSWSRWSSGSGMRPVSAYLYQKRMEWRQKQRRYKKVTDYRVPVLFASSHGLHIRMVSDTFEGSRRRPKPTTQPLNAKGQWDLEPKFITSFCDLEASNPMPRVTRPPLPPSRSMAPKNNVSLEDDEGFCDTSSSDKVPLVVENEFQPTAEGAPADPAGSGPKPMHKKKVNFKTQVEEIRSFVLGPNWKKRSEQRPTPVEYYVTPNSTADFGSHQGGPPNSKGKLSSRQGGPASSALRVNQKIRVGESSRARKSSVGAGTPAAVIRQVQLPKKRQSKA